MAMQYVQFHLNHFEAMCALDDETLGRIMKAAYQYCRDGAEPSFPASDMVARMAWGFTKSALQSSMSKYEAKAKAASASHESRSANSRNNSANSTNDSATCKDDSANSRNNQEIAEDSLHIAEEILHREDKIRYDKIGEDKIGEEKKREDIPSLSPSSPPQSETEPESTPGMPALVDGEIPTEDMVRAYAEAKGYTKFKCVSYFMMYYEHRGWKSDKGVPVKRWWKLVDMWESDPTGLKLGEDGVKV